MSGVIIAARRLYDVPPEIAGFAAGLDDFDVFAGGHDLHARGVGCDITGVFVYYGT